MPGSASELGSHTVPPQTLSSWQISAAGCCPIAKLVSPARSLHPTQAWNGSLEKELVRASPSVEAASPTVWYAMRAFPLPRQMSSTLHGDEGSFSLQSDNFAGCCLGSTEYSLTLFSAVFSKKQKASAPMLPTATVLRGQYKERRDASYILPCIHIYTRQVGFVCL